VWIELKETECEKTAEKSERKEDVGATFAIDRWSRAIGEGIPNMRGVMVCTESIECGRASVLMRTRQSGRYEMPLQGSVNFLIKTIVASGQIMEKRSKVTLTNNYVNPLLNKEIMSLFSIIEHLKAKWRRRSLERLLFEKRAFMQTNSREGEKNCAALGLFPLRISFSRRRWKDPTVLLHPLQMNWWMSIRAHATCCCFQAFKIVGAKLWCCKVFLGDV